MNKLVAVFFSTVSAPVHEIAVVVASHICDSSLVACQNATRFQNKKRSCFRIVTLVLSPPGILAVRIPTAVVALLGDVL